MAGLLFHDAPETVRHLAVRLAAALADVPGSTADGLLERLTLDQPEAPRLAVTGPFSTGKSTLINALTDGSAKAAIGADITTDTVTAYNWDGAVILLDTPGVHSGIAEHDRLSQDALSRAELVLFAVSVDLFDDDSTSQLRYIADDLGKRDQLVVVITKKNTMPADPAVRADAVRRAAGGPPTPPFVECDALDYLEGLASSDPRRREALVEMSGLEEVKSAINHLAARRGQLARFRQPFQLIHTLAVEALAQLTDDPTEQATLIVLARQQKALTSHESRIESALRSHRAQFRAESGTASERFADTIEAIDEMPEGEERTDRVQLIVTDLQSDLAAAAARLASDVEGSLQHLLNDLASEVGEITAGGHAQFLESRVAANFTTPPLSPQPLDPRFSQNASGDDFALPAWLNDAQDWVASFQEFWGAGRGARQSAGTVGHEIVLEVGHFFGKKFRPWQAVNVADKIGKAATAASVALPIALALANTALEERARSEAEKRRRLRRNGLIGEVLRQADLIADDASLAVQASIRPQFEAAYRGIERLREEINATRRNRSAVESELQSICRECQGQLQLLVDQ